MKKVFIIKAVEKITCNRFKNITEAKKFAKNNFERKFTLGHYKDYEVKESKRN